VKDWWEQQGIRWNTKGNLSEERQKESEEAKMASRKETAEGARGPSDLSSNTSCMKTESYLEVTGGLASVYQEGEEQGQGGLSRSVGDMEFVRRTMLTTQVQNVVVRIEMVGQYLILTASKDDGQRLKQSMRAFKSALAWGMELLNHIGRHCKWARCINEITKLPLEFATKRRMQQRLCAVGEGAHRNDASSYNDRGLESDRLPRVLRGLGDEFDGSSYSIRSVRAGSVEG
jgi:hypothetical protein